MQAGRLDRRITIQSATKTQDAAGEPIETWTTFADVPAEKRDVRPGERFRASQVLAVETTTFRIRYRSGITPEMRISYDGKIYDIEGIDEIGRKEGLDLTATARRVGA